MKYLPRQKYLQRIGKNSALRVAFITDSLFEEENARSNGNLKKRALRQVQRNVGYPVVENSMRPDAVFTIYRVAGRNSWCLRYKKLHNEV